TVLSRRQKVDLAYKEVETLLHQVKSFTIHFDERAVTVTLPDGLFHMDGKQYFHPQHIPGDRILFYRRVVQGEFVDGQMQAEVSEYHMGYRVGVTGRGLSITPDGKHTWAVFDNLPDTFKFNYQGGYYTHDADK
ncbi:MAG: hypothetical protein WCI01_11770, partial [Chlorobiaceae bacterium]